ncbi:MAG: CDP-alcohol phosphatidyltransferase family protein [Cyanobacteria bacterium P01_C01_bin.120]
MLTLYHVKPTLQKLLRPLVRHLAHWGVTPNQITIAAIVLSGGGGLAIALYPTNPWPLLALSPVLFVRMVLNALDGTLAREYRLASPLGCLLNEVGDVVADALLYLPLALVPGVSAGWIVVLVVLAILTEFIGVLGLAIAQHRDYSGPFGKSDRAFVFGMLGLAWGLGLPLGPWQVGIWSALSALALLTLWHRSRAALREVTSCR